MSEDKKQGAGSLLLLKQEEKIITLLYQKNRLIRANISNPEKTVLHHIFIGKVKNVVQNIQSAFIEYAPGKLCHLPLKECTNPVVLNRTYDGRVVAGDELLIQIVSEPQKRKEAGASANLSFSGKYIVLTSGDKHVGYSAKLSRPIKEELKLWQKQSESFRHIYFISK